MSGTAPKVLSAGQMKELASALTEAIPTDLPAETAQCWISDKKALGVAVKQMLFDKEKDVSEILFLWHSFYLRFFTLDLDFSSLRIPEKPTKGKWRLIVVAKGFTPNQVYDICAKHFPCWRYIDNLDANVTRNDREPKETYAIWVRNRQEADEELKNLSADQLKEQKIPGITLLERLLYELKYWDETQKHLDVQNWTLCAGSRYSVGSVPSVSWRGSRLRVRWDGPGGRSGGLRSRAAVPCQP